MNDLDFGKLASRIARSFAKNNFEFDEYKQHLWLQFLENKPTSHLTEELHELKFLNVFCSNEIKKYQRKSKTKKVTLDDLSFEEFQLRESARQLIEGTEELIEAKELKKEKAFFKALQADNDRLHDLLDNSEDNVKRVSLLMSELKLNGSIE